MGYLRNRLTIPVKGYNRSIIYDLTRKDYFYISNSLFEEIYSDSLLNISNNKDKLFLLDEEIIFQIEDKELNLFPSIDYNFKDPFDFNNIFIDSDISLNYNSQFNKALVYNFSIIIKKSNNTLVFSNTLKKMILQIEPESIDIHFIEDEIQINNVNLDLLDSYSQIFNLYFYNSNINKKVKNKIKNKGIECICISESFSTYMKNQFPTKFSVNIEHFLEAKNHNVYFNKNLYIEKDGKISNGLTSNVICEFEDFKSHVDLLSLSKLTRFWDVTKEKTLVCNDCEFRYMCVDSRIPQKKQKSVWFYKNECNYNPYISKWKNEKGYKTLNDSGITTNSKDLTIKLNLNKLSEAFKQAWE